MGLQRSFGRSAVAIAIALLAVGPAVAPVAAQEKTFVFGTNFDPQGGCDATQTVVVALTLSCPQLVSEPLVKFDFVTNEVVPALAESWTTTEDSVTFKLRQGVQFSDGTPFDADAVVFNFQRVWVPRPRTTPATPSLMRRSWPSRASRRSTTTRSR